MARKKENLLPRSNSTRLTSLPIVMTAAMFLAASGFPSEQPSGVES
jgi:hypothetical protein